MPLKNVRKSIQSAKVQDMVDRQQKALREWIARGLKKPGKTASGLAKHMGFANHTPVSKMLPDAKKHRKIQTYEIDLISEYLGEAPPMHQTSVAPVSKPEQVIFLVGYVRLGAWVEKSMLPTAISTEIQPFLGARYANVPQRALEVRDDHADMYAKAGSLVTYVDYEAVNLSPDVGDVVVLEREMQGTEGPMLEMTLREVARGVGADAGRLVLRSLSSKSPRPDIPLDAENPLIQVNKYVIGTTLYKAR